MVDSSDSDDEACDGREENAQHAERAACARRQHAHAPPVDEHARVGRQLQSRVDEVVLFIVYSRSLTHNKLLLYMVKVTETLIRFLRT